jgi:hypothetical protein
MNDLGAPPAMAMLNGAEFYVYPWDDGSMVLPGVSHALYWHRCDANGCTAPRRIPGQLSLGRANLAAYNGLIYMVHQGDSDSTAVYFTHLDPNSGQWTPDVRLSNVTFGGAPALAAYGGRLYMVGSQQRVLANRTTTYPLWSTSMGTDEVFSPSSGLFGEESASPPSLAVINSTLYVAHRWGQTSQIVMQSMTTNSPWSAVTHIYAGPSNANIEGDDVQIAAVNGFLHLIHHRWSGNETWWTYNHGCDGFAPEVSISGFRFGSRSSMATSIKGLAINGLVDEGVWPYTHNNWDHAIFTAPPPPTGVNRCSVFIGGGGGIGGINNL